MLRSTFYRLMFLSFLSLYLLACGVDPETAERNRLHQEHQEQVVAEAFEVLQRANDDPSLDNIRPLFRLTDMTREVAYGTKEHVFSYGPPMPITIVAMANLLINRQRDMAVEAALSMLDERLEAAVPLDTTAELKLRWLVDEISNLPRAMLSVPVAIPREDGRFTTIGYIEARSGFIPGQRVIVDQDGLARLLPYLRERLVR